MYFLGIHNTQGTDDSWIEKLAACLRSGVDTRLGEMRKHESYFVVFVPATAKPLLGSLDSIVAPTDPSISAVDLVMELANISPSERANWIIGNWRIDPTKVASLTPDDWTNLAELLRHAIADSIATKSCHV